jgi:hypothetical protein
MHCTRCKGRMVVMEQSIGPSSTQTWFQCMTCSGQRVLTADRLRYVVGSGQSLRSRFRLADPTRS